MSPETVILRPEGGAAIGLGHVQRCIALAQALIARGLTARFLVADDPVVQERVAAFGFPVDCRSGAPGGPGDTESLRAVARAHGASVVVVDSYLLNDRYTLTLRTAGLRVVVIDDLAQWPISADVVVSSGAGADALPYRVAPHTRLLLGPRYALLRPEFWEVAPREARSVRSVLLTLGGTDPFDLMPRLVRALDALPPSVGLTVVIGPFFANAAATRAVVSAVARPVTVVERPTAMRALMDAADLAITAGGQTTLELAATGLPAIAIELADNQRPGLMALATAGVILLAGRGADPTTPERCARLVERLLWDPSRRAQMTYAGQSLVDGQGARRVAEVMAALAR